MASLTALPTEMLDAIVSHLNMFDRAAVARTMNRVLYSVARRGLDLAWINNAQHMVARFYQDFPRVTSPMSLFSPPAELTAQAPQPSFPGHLPPFPFGPIEGFYYALPRRITLLPDTLVASYGLDPRGRPYVRNSPPYLRDCLNLDGTFAWLTAGVRPDSSDREESEDDDAADRPLLEPDELAALQRQVRGLGLTLPNGFDTFVRNLQFRRRIDEVDCWRLEIGKLVKCPASVDGDAGGYLLNFYYDAQGCGSASLYLDPQGRHCVLGSPRDPESFEHIDSIALERYNASPSIHEVDVQSNTTDPGEEEKEEDHDDEQCLPAKYVSCARKVIEKGGVFRSEFEAAKAERLQLCLEWRKENYMLHAFDFEEFLATVYFEGSIGCDPTNEPGLKEYVSQVFTPLLSKNRDLEGEHKAHDPCGPEVDPSSR